MKSSALEERCLYRITSRRELVLAQFSGAGLAALNLDARLLTTVDYAVPQAWSRWVCEAPAGLDGILYPSRALGGVVNLALFERSRAVLVEEDLGSLWTWRSDDGDSDILDILDEQGWGLV